MLFEGRRSGDFFSLFKICNPFALTRVSLVPPAISTAVFTLTESIIAVAGVPTSAFEQDTYARLVFCVTAVGIGHLFSLLLGLSHLALGHSFLGNSLTGTGE